MGDTVLQNVQRAILMVEFLSIFIICFFLTLRIIKKQIDISKKKDEEPSQTSGAKYKEADSSHHFDNAAIRSTTFQQTDTCTERFIKKICDYNVTFNPLLIALPLNFILGKSMSFCLTIYFVSLVTCFFFNVFKIHRLCIQHKVSRLFIELIWICLSILILLNIWTTNTSSMLYRLSEK